MPNLPTNIHYYVTNVQLFAQFCIDTCKNELTVVQNVRNSFKNGYCTDLYICTFETSNCCFTVLSTFWLVSMAFPQYLTSEAVMSDWTLKEVT